MNELSKTNWHNIKIDSEVFAMLQRYAKPLVDSANDVLRKLLLKEVDTKHHKSRIIKNKSKSGPVLVNSAAFVQFLLHDRFGKGFKSVDRYQYMFESNKERVYFQNYNKEADVLWYRINKMPRNYLKSSQKRAWICLTNPIESCAYIIPVAKIETHATRINWRRPELEVHIYTKQSLWKELDWCIAQYRYEPKQP